MVGRWVGLLFSPASPKPPIPLGVPGPSRQDSDSNSTAPLESFVRSTKLYPLYTVVRRRKRRGRLVINLDALRCALFIASDQRVPRFGEDTQVM